jgi:hypothetical protein
MLVVLFCGKDTTCVAQLRYLTSAKKWLIRFMRIVMISCGTRRTEYKAGVATTRYFPIWGVRYFPVGAFP